MNNYKCLVAPLFEVATVSGELVELPTNLAT